MLNIPERFEEEIAELIQEDKKVILLGVGGGYDILSCLPLYYTLRLKGCDVELANYSLVDFDLFPSLAEPFIMNQQIYGANAHIKANTDHYPEGHLSKWLKTSFNEDVTVWMLKQQQSVVELTNNLNVLIEKLNGGVLILCGSGARSIMMGDEEGCGEILFTTIVMAAIRQIPTRSMLFTIGVNTAGGKRSESVFNAMENTQFYKKNNHYYGSASLEKNMDSFQYYKSAYEYVISQPGHSIAAAHELTITAVLGGFGPHANGGFVCPSSAECNFYDAIGVSNYNLLIPHIETIPVYDDIVQRGLSIIHEGINKRPREVLPA